MQLTKTILSIIVIFSAVSCGGIYETSVPVSVEKEVIKEVIVPTKQKFEGVFYLKNNSTIELISDSENKVTIDTSIQNLTSKNPKNGTFGEHPRMTGSNLLVKDEKIRWTLNVNYTSGHDLEEDVSGSNIIGTKRTDYLVEFVKGKLRLTVSIWGDKIGNNVNNVVAKRVLSEI